MFALSYTNYPRRINRVIWWATSDYTKLSQFLYVTLHVGNPPLIICSFQKGLHKMITILSG